MAARGQACRYAVNDLCAAAAERRIFVRCFQYLHDMDGCRRRSNTRTIARLAAPRWRPATLQLEYRAVGSINRILYRSKSILNYSKLIAKCDRYGNFATC